MIRFSLVMGLALAALPSAVQADSSDHRNGYSRDGQRPGVAVEGMTPWSNGNADSATHYDARTGRVTGYEINRGSTTIQRGPNGEFEGIISRPNRQPDKQE